MFFLLQGVALTLVAIFSVSAHFEDRLITQIVENVAGDAVSDQQKAIALLDATHAMLRPRLEIFGGESYIGIRDTLFRSTDIHLLDSKGVCGSHAHVLGRLLQRAGMPIRMAQMKCGEHWGCHILLEARVDGRFVVLDPLYNLAFMKADGSLASFDEVSRNWPHFALQVPGDYPLYFAYEDVRYTNWNKIPVIMPAIRNILQAFIGDDVRFISIRPLFLNVYRFYAVVALILYMVLVVTTVILLRSGRKRRSTATADADHAVTGTTLRSTEASVC